MSGIDIELEAQPEEEDDEWWENAKLHVPCEVLGGRDPDELSEDELALYAPQE